MNNPRLALLAAMAGTALLAACNVQESKNENGSKDVAIKTPFGNMNVATNDVKAQETGIAAYPGATLKPNASEHNDSKANVNIDTPWFGVKVVAVTYLTDDPPEKVWAFYKKELSHYGRVLECKPGSADMDLKKEGKDDLTCQQDHHKHNVNIDSDKESLKVGTENHQHVVAVKPSGKGTEFNLVFVAAHEGQDG